MTTQTSQPPPPRPRTRESGAERRQRIGDAALSVLAAEGMRGLTHRAVDEAAALPQGSTSNVFRSRAALLEGALERHAARDLEAAGPAPTPDQPMPEISREQATELIAATVESVVRERRRTVARFELLLESTRRPELREPIEQARRGFSVRAALMLAATGCAAPERHARQLLAVLDGVLMADLHGDEAALDHDEIVELVGRTFTGC